MADKLKNDFCQDIFDTIMSLFKIRDIQREHLRKICFLLCSQIVFYISKGYFCKLILFDLFFNALAENLSCRKF